MPGRLFFAAFPTDFTRWSAGAPHVFGPAGL